MGEAPSTAQQLALFVAVVLPGVTYQFVRERWRGPIPAEAQLGHRVLRAVTASIVLDGLYLILLGPRLHRAYGDYRGGRLFDHPRGVGLYVLVLLLGVPAAAAWLVSWRERRRLRSRYLATPTAWDHMFRDLGVSYVRVRLKDGSWVGGRYGPNSFATSHPQGQELYLETAYRMGPDGGFLAEVEGTRGVYVRVSEADVVELLEPRRRETRRETGPDKEGSPVTSVDPQPPDDLTAEELRLLAADDRVRGYRPSDEDEQPDEPPPGPAGVSAKPPPQQKD